MPMLEVSREGWHARAASADMAALQYPLHSVFVTFTHTDECQDMQECSRVLQELQKAHQDDGEPDIKYSFMVGGDGRVYEGRGWANTTCPPVSVPCQHKSLIIAHIGPPTVEDPCKFMERATGSIIDFGYRAKYIDDDTNYFIPYQKDSSFQTVGEYRVEQAKRAKQENQDPTIKPALLL